MSLEYRYVLSTPDSSTGNSSLTLTHLPVGWEDIDYSFKRSENDGIFHDIVTDLKFIKEGRDWLADLYAEKETYAEAFCTIYKKNPSTQVFEFFYNGKVDFTTCEVDKNYFTCNLETESFQQNFLNSLDKKYDVSTYLDSAGASQNNLRTVTTHSKGIRTQLQANSANAIYDDLANSGLIPTPSYADLYFPVEATIETVNEIDAFNYQVFLKSTSLVDDKQYLFKAKKNGTYIITGTVNAILHEIQGASTGINSITVNVIKVDNEGVQTTLTTFTFNNDGASTFPNTAIPSTLYSLTNQVINDVEVLEEGDEIYLQGHIDYVGLQSSTIQHYYVYENSSVGTNISVVATNYNDTKDISAVTYYDALLSICQQITGEIDCFRSDWLGDIDSHLVQYEYTGEGSLGVYTTGNLLKGETGRAFSMSFSDIIDDLNFKFGCGFNISRESITDAISGSIQTKYIVRVEPRTEFYQDSEALDLMTQINLLRDDELRYLEDWTKTPAQDRVYSKIEEKLPQPKVTGFSLLDEFMTERTFSTKANQSTNTYSLNTPFKHSGWEIELQKFPADEDKKESNIDDDIFAFSVYRDIDGSLVSDVNNFASALASIGAASSEYNIRHAPRLSLINYHTPWVSVSQLGLTSGGTTDDILFVDGKLNYIVNIAGETENSDISSLFFPVLRPQYYEIEVPLTNTALQTIKSNPLKYLSFSILQNGVVQEIQGHIQEMELIEAREYQDLHRIKLITRAQKPIDSITINWSLTEDLTPAFGDANLRIDVNGVNFVLVTGTNSGSFLVDPYDEIQVYVWGESAFFNPANDNYTFLSVERSNDYDVNLFKEQKQITNYVPTVVGELKFKFKAQPDSTYTIDGQSIVE